MDLTCCGNSGRQMLDSIIQLRKYAFVTSVDLLARPQAIKHVAAIQDEACIHRDRRIISHLLTRAEISGNRDITKFGNLQKQYQDALPEMTKNAITQDFQEYQQQRLTELHKGMLVR
eukprot:GHVT01015305.1.p4 GENE.GHVT01015305.1~~GHVT01015305.1.p4  ORF type:complete len:117 (-),score=3.29 GHVT01015305.1:2829-3179(-)